MRLEQEKYLRFRHNAYEMKKDILCLCHECGTQKGHLGGCLSAVDILNVLYTEVMNLKDPAVREQKWEERDRFVMSKGHAGIAMYAALKQAGILQDDDLRKGIRGDKTILYRHPKYNPDYAIECSVGSLGMGIGYAVGLAEVAKKKQLNYRTYVMLGDGECNEGSVWESLAYASHRQLSGLTVIVDKNGLQLDGKTSDVLDLGNLANKFEAFGFFTIEIDGHDYSEIYDAFHQVSDGRPIAIVASTRKGKGLSFTEDKVEWHDNYLSDELYVRGLEEIEASYTDEEKEVVNQALPGRKKDVNSGHSAPPHKPLLSYGEKEIVHLSGLGCKDVVGFVSEQLADMDPGFVLSYSDCANRIGITALKQKHPDKCLEMGIAEQNQIAVSAAFANNGYHPFSIAYAPFITARVLDQVRSLLGYMKSPVKLIGLTAGFAASDLGATHTALEDISNMRAIPNIKVVCPADCLEIAKAMAATVDDDAPVYIRITAPIESSPMVYKKDYAFEVGKAVTLREGEDVAIVGCGSILSSVLECAEQLSQKGVSVRVVNMHTIKPLDTAVLQSLLDYRLIVTVEEHNVIGGLGAAVSEYYAQFAHHAPLLKIGVPDEYYVADLPYDEYRRAGITKDQILEKIINNIKTC